MKLRSSLIFSLLVFICEYSSGQENPKLRVLEKIQSLVNSVSRKGSSTISAEQKSEFSEWLSINKEAITNVKPYKITGEGPAMTDTSGIYKATDFKFATDGNAVYVFVMTTPTRDMLIKSLRTTPDYTAIATVTLLGSTERISWEQREAELLIEKPAIVPPNTVLVFKLTFQKYYRAK